MRRSLNSNKSVLLIIMVAVFTLISYFFDQMVIRQEDTLRNNQIKLENLNVKIDTLTSVSEAPQSTACPSVSSSARNNHRPLSMDTCTCAHMNRQTHAQPQAQALYHAAPLRSKLLWYRRN